MPTALPARRFVPVLAAAISLVAAERAGAETAQQILEATGIKGGLIVHVGCGDGMVTADLRANERYIVHGLAAEFADVVTARQNVRERGLSGVVSVDTWDGKSLPFIENLVNLIVVSNGCVLGMAEAERVLAPGGVVLYRGGTSEMAPGGLAILAVYGPSKDARAFKKRVPANIDEWTHYLHDPGNNAVAHDTVTGLPAHYQWHGSPRWSRHHELMSSTSALVSANGRVFHIFDEGSKASTLLPPKWYLTGRDAFNGTILWKRPIEKWFIHLWPLKSGPADLPRRLVAIDDRVYVTLGIDAPVSLLDAATGETVRTYAETAGTHEIVVDNGVMLLAVVPPERLAAEAITSAENIGDIHKKKRDSERDGTGRFVMAVDTENGKVLWRHGTQVVPCTLAAAGGHAFYYDGDKIVCLDAKTGAQQWISESLPRSKKFPTYYAPTLVVYKDVILFTGGENMLPLKGAQDTMQALDVRTGKRLWTAEHPPSGYQSPEDILVANGLVWTGATTQSEDSGEFTGRDPLTGEIRKHYKPKRLPTTGYGHHRCFRAKATDRFVMASSGGINFLDVNTTEYTTYSWIRGVCLYGFMPCNGLIYAPPHDCACSMDNKLSAFSAVAPQSSSWTPPKEVDDPNRLEKGPAYKEGMKDEGGGMKAEKAGGDGTTGSDTHPSTADWPMHRRDAMRSGFTPSSVPAEVTRQWEAKIGGRLSAPVVANGKVFVAAVDAHTVHAIDMASGKIAWSRTVGGRVDSAPTLWQDLVLFGATDGYVHCLRANDGEMVWRFRAAPEDRRMVGFEQVESVWPVSGSVLVVDTPEGGVVYCIAGRSVFLDGGTRLVRLDAHTGKLLSETLLDNRGRPGRKQVPAPDILSSDGDYVFLKTCRFGLDGSEKGSPTRDIKEQLGDGVHLFSPTSLLDDAWWHRSYWVYGRAFQHNATGYYNAGLMAPAGRILCFDDETVYGFGRKAKYYRWTTPMEYTLFAAEKGRGEIEMPKQRRGKESSVRIPVSDTFSPGTGATTFETWVSADAGNGAIMARGGKPDGMVLLVWAGKPKFVVRTGKTYTTISGKKSIVKRWVHLAAVLTPDRKMELYVDGTLAGTADLPRFPQIPATEKLDLGLDSAPPAGKYKGAYGFVGMLDDVRVYTQALSAEQIRNHAGGAGAGAADDSPKPAVHYTFDCDKIEKGTHLGTAADASGNERMGETTDLKFANGKFGRAAKFIGTRPPIKKLPFAVKHRWAQDIPILVRAMVVADKTLFIAGPPDVVDEEKAARNLADPAIQASLRDQDAANAGKKGSILRAVSATDGTTLSEMTLDTMPVFDGLIAAHGRLFLSTADGRLVCMGKK